MERKEEAIEFLNSMENIVLKFKDGLEFVKSQNAVVSEKKVVEINDFEKIIYLDLSNNNLLGLPRGLSSLSNLEVVILDNNHFSKPTRVLRGLKNLRVLSMKNNSLSYLPKGLTIMT